MKNIRGLLVKLNREELGFKQEYLCNGICAISYLSKIEKGEIIPSDEIMNLLFTKLDMECCMDEKFIHAGKSIFNDIFESELTGIEIEPEKFKFIQKYNEQILISP